MNNKSHDIITVTYSGDLALLYYHVLSLKKMWRGDKNFTLVIEDNSQETLAWCEKYIAPILDGWNTTFLLPPLELANLDLDGWHKQQLCKLWASARSCMEYSIIFDCKNFLIRPYSFEENFEGDNLLVQLYDDVDLSQNDKLLIQNTCDFLNKDFEKVTKAYTITPFIWKNQYVRELMEYANQHTEINHDFISNTTEAYLYWTFAQDKLKYQKTSRSVQIGQYGGIDNNDDITFEKFYNLVSEAKNENYPILTLHRFHTTPDKIKTVFNLFKELGIIDESQAEHHEDFFKYAFKKSMKYVRPMVRENLEQYWGAQKIINYKDKNLEFNRLVVYGCSYTAGDETADHEFLPHLTLDQINKEKKRLGPKDFGQVYFKDLNILKLKKQREHENVWAGKLAKKIGVDYVNRAISGNSIQGIIYDIESDFVKNKLYDTDLIIIGVTSPQRWFYLDDLKVKKTPLYGYPHFWPSDSVYENFITYFSHSNFLIYNMINGIKYLDMLSKKFNGKILMQYMHWSLNQQVICDYDQLSDVVKLMAQDIDRLDSIIDKDFSFGDVIDWNTETYGFFHPIDRLQEKMADHIYQKLGIINE